MSKNGRVIGYARVSTADQNLTRQQKALKDYGCDIIYEEKKSGKRKDNRPQFNKMMSSLQPGDTVVTLDITRMSRSTADLIHIVNELKEKEVDFVSLNDSWLNTEGPMGDFIFTIMAGLAQYERALTSERIKEGIAAVKAKGKKVGAPRKNAKKVDDAVDKYLRREGTAKELVKEAGISRTQFFHHVREAKKEKKIELTDKKKKKK